MDKQALQKLSHCVYALNYHIVLVTKYRRRVLTAMMLDRTRAMASHRCEAWDGRLVEMNGEADHVHFVVSLPPTKTLSEFANALKTNTSRLLRSEFALELGQSLQATRPLVTVLLRHFPRRCLP
jgi:putative transposase